ncbi:MAG: hypothetical protein R3B48_27685 [Kofleriaceae bacterium]
MAPRPALSNKQRALLAEQLRRRDVAAVKAALQQVAAQEARELTRAVVGLLSSAQSELVIEALQTLGALGAAAELDRAEATLPAPYHGWINVARQRLGAAPPRGSSD